MLKERKWRGLKEKINNFSESIFYNHSIYFILMESFAIERFSFTIYRRFFAKEKAFVYDTTLIFLNTSREELLWYEEDISGVRGPEN